MELTQKQKQNIVLALATGYKIPCTKQVIEVLNSLGFKRNVNYDWGYIAYIKIIENLLNFPEYIPVNNYKKEIIIFPGDFVKTLTELGIMSNPESSSKCILKPFDKVLVQAMPNSTIWHADIFSKMVRDRFECVSGIFPVCIPYEGNEHLLN